MAWFVRDGDSIQVFLSSLWPDVRVQLRKVGLLSALNLLATVLWGV